MDALTPRSEREDDEETTQYVQLVNTILNHGELRCDRTGVGTRAIFGGRLCFNLANNTMPLLTTKRVFWRGVVEELLWIIRGGTTTKPLVDVDVHIWDANGTREALDARGLREYKPGDLGPIYGWQCRHWGCSKWRDDEHNLRCSYAPAECLSPGEQDSVLPSTQVNPGEPAPCGGVDQLAELLHGLRTDPWSRRHVINMWNVSDLKKMALPPCHVMSQFYVSSDDADFENGETTPKPKYLSCQLTMRSCDVGLGLPFNIASYALLTHLIARHCGLEAKALIIVTGDTHIYTNHVDALREQVARKPLGFPKLVWATSDEMELVEPFDLLRVTSDQIMLKGYRAHPAVSMKMAT